jgi:4-diphosphocytidyl-2-C-methyl-D-erythritol kinase
MLPVLSTACYAKINLNLAVARALPREHPHAGMHPIASCIAPITLADALTIETLAPRGATDASVYDITHFDGSAVDWPIESDLAFRAHRALQDHLHTTLPIRLSLVKKIPAGAGLGGGSSDAAATLRSLNTLFDLKLPLQTLRALAGTLGSDIPFFIDDTNPPRPALVTGLGHTIERLPPATLPILLVIPPFACSTAAVYHAFDQLPPLPDHRDRAIAAVRNALDADLFNDLWPAACNVQPALADLHHRAHAAIGLPVHLSGSGSAMFSIAPHTAQPTLAAALPECGVLPLHTLAPPTSPPGARP